MKKIIFYCVLTLLITFKTTAQYTANTTEENTENWPEHTYNLTIDYKTVNYTGKDIKAMSINGGIPGPTLEFTQGEFAIINVTNNMDTDTSIHWHGIILPNYYDGVPYLTTPPIKPGQTLQYKFAIKQPGTYWYHSHTGLQEQRGVYGSIKINPKKKDFDYDKDLILVLSDWMDETPESQLKNLKRGNEWYLIKKNQIQSWDKIISKKAVGAKLKMIWQRMPDMAILDNYYDRFLVNGMPLAEYPEFNPGEKVRVRFINASAATYFWLTFGGEDPVLIAADGLDVEPVQKNKTLISIAETYDFIVTIPESGKLQIRATSQDGSGEASAFLGKGQVIEAPQVPKPDLIQLMKEMMAMKMKMGAPAAKYRPRVNDSISMMKKYAMKMEGMKMHSTTGGNMDSMGMENKSMRDSIAQPEMAMKHHMDGMKGHHTDEMKNMEMDGMKMGYTLPADKVIGDPMKTGGNPEFNYNYLKSPQKTTYDENRPVKEMLFNLTGNMNRYVWSINGIPISETDNIKINKGEVVRITLNNMTMMHHPMHLHGHFFRVLNKNGEYSPLKHTVNVAPMQKVVIEFEATEYGDWFFHCHVLYHMSSGMARVFSYGTPRDPRMAGLNPAMLTNEADHMYKWGSVTASSHMAALYYTVTNIRNQFIVNTEYGWNRNFEGEFTYSRWLNSYFRVFGGVNVENKFEDNLENIEATAVVGARELLPLLITADVRIDNKLRPQIGLSKSTMVTRHIALFGEYEYQMDFGWVNNFSPDDNFVGETTWQAGLEYIFSRNFSVVGSYDNRFGWGGGLNMLF